MPYFYSLSKEKLSAASHPHLQRPLPQLGSYSLQVSCAGKSTGKYRKVLCTGKSELSPFFSLAICRTPSLNSERTWRYGITVDSICRIIISTVS